MQLFECLQRIPDLRKKRGIRHPFQPVLKFVLLGFTCRLVAIEHIVSFFRPIWNQLKGQGSWTGMGSGKIEKSGVEYSQNIGRETGLERRKHAEMERSVTEQA